MGSTKGVEKAAILDITPETRPVETSPSRSKRVVACVGVALAVMGALVAFQGATTEHAAKPVQPVQPLTLASAHVSQIAQPVTLASAQVSQLAPPTDVINPIFQSGQQVMIICAQDNKCIDDGDAKSGGSSVAVHLYTCNSDNENQRFAYNAATKAISNPLKSNLCWDDSGVNNGGLRLKACSGNDNTKFIYDWTTRAFKIPTKPGKCVDASGDFKYQDCDPRRPSQQFDIVPKSLW